MAMKDTFVTFLFPTHPSDASSSQCSLVHFLLGAARLCHGVFEPSQPASRVQVNAVVVPRRM